MSGLQTKFNEERFITADLKQMLGKYLAKRVLKTWNEDFIDEDTGEIVTIERNEVIFERGTYIDNDMLTQINFCIQCEDITEVEVSSQCRLATLNKRGNLWPFKVNAIIGGKNYSFVLQAQSPSKAIEVATDHIELNYTQGFDISAIKALKSLVILNDRFKKKVVDSATPEEIIEGFEDEDQECSEAEEKRDDTKYYKIEAVINILSNEDEEPASQTLDFLVKTKDVDAAKIVITAWINNKFKEENSKTKLIDISILSATPFSCNSIIDKEFCLAYLDKTEQ